VELEWAPGQPLKLDSPDVTTQAYAPVPAGGEQSVQWELRADKAGTSTITITLRDAASTVLATDEAVVEVVD